MNARRALLSALLTFAGVLASTSVAAQEQPWLRDRRLTDGPGYTGERFEVHGGISGGASYDSNVFLRADTREAPRADAFVLSVTPFVSFATRESPEGPRPSVGFSGAAAVTYYEYIPGPTKGLSSDDVAGNRNVGALGNIAAIFAPGAKLSGDIHAGVSRSIQPSNLGDPTASYDRTTPVVGAGINWKPGGGLFLWRVGYDLAYTYFEAQRFREYDNFVHTVSSKASWRFLPRTRLFSDVTVSRIQYTSSVTPQTDGDTVTARAGVDGLITRSVGFLAAGGWASTMFQAKPGQQAQDFDSFIAQAELRFYLSAPPRREDEPGVYPTTLALGYTRDWNQSYIGNFYYRDRGYAALGYFFNGVVLATLTGGISRLSFPESYFPDGTPANAAFTAIEADAALFLEYRITPHFGVNLTGQYQQMISDARLRGDEANATIGQDFKWTRYVATLGVRYLF